VAIGGRRHQGRELALQALFQLESHPDDDPDQVLAYHAEDLGVTAATQAFAADLVRGVREHQEQLDGMIRAYSYHWSLEQMGKVDRMVLRIAVYEITIARDVPVKAAINESIELAKTYSSVDSGRFVNGILGRVAESVHQ
jgi:N utilization substance protein B